MFNNGRVRVILGAVLLLAVSAAPALAAAPTNDDLANRTVVGAIPYTDSQDTTEATPEPGDPNCDGAGPTVWYEYTPEEDVRLEANTFGSDYDTTLVVAVDDGGGLDIVACNDDSGSLQSRVRFDAQEGVRYYFMVGAYDGGPGGELTFNLLEAPPSQPLSLSISLDQTGSFQRDGSAIVRGTATCSGADWVEVEGYLSQRVGRFTISGWGWGYGECDPDGASFEMYFQSSSGSFGGGQAQLFVEAWACGDEDCASDFQEASIRLRK